jgi:hypothetical protein
MNLKIGDSETPKSRNGQLAIAEGQERQDSENPSIPGRCAARAIRNSVTLWSGAADDPRYTFRAWLVSLCRLFAL